MTFYDILREVSREKKTSPCAVAEAIGMSKSNVSRWKKGYSPRLDVVIKIAKYLEVDPECLVRGD